MDGLKTATKIYTLSEIVSNKLYKKGIQNFIEKNLNIILDS